MSDFPQAGAASVTMTGAAHLDSNRLLTQAGAASVTMSGSAAGAAARLQAGAASVTMSGSAAPWLNRKRLSIYFMDSTAIASAGTASLWAGMGTYRLPDSD
jgi:hypothetical protein